MGARLHSLRLSYFQNNLETLQQRNLEAFHSIVRDLINAKDDDLSFYGFRFETYIASRLARENISFHKRESPDFDILNYSNASIECTSIRSRGGNIDEERLDQKLHDRVSEKSLKTYATHECSLFIDVTNILFNVPPDTWQARMDSFEDAARTQIVNTDFGSILIFTWIYSQKTDSCTYVSNRVDSTFINSELRSFLETYFPHKGASTKRPAVSREA